MQWINVTPTSREISYKERVSVGAAPGQKVGAQMKNLGPAKIAGGAICPAMMEMHS